MTDIDLLKKKIADSGLKMVFIAEKMGIMRQTLYNKVNGLSEFNQSEIALLCEILNIKTKAEKESIFFKKN